MVKILMEEELDNSVCFIIGTRPGIIMFSPIIRECLKRKVNFFIIHTGQHYSYNMDKAIFNALDLPGPEFHLEGVAGKKYHGSQTAAMLEGVEEILLKERPALVLVGGDANTNLAGALAARKLQLNVGHVEAGERSYDWRMPEEHNRRMIDHISNLLFTTNEKGAKRLKEEKVMGEVYVTGNTIVDAADQNFEIAKAMSTIIEDNGLEPKKYCILTAHREENVDVVENLVGILEGIERFIAEMNLPVFFAAHPRTLNRLENFGLLGKVKKIPALLLREAPGYLDFLKLLASSRLVFTDSGGVQQEASIFKVHCVTLRENTEWTETLDIGANQLAGTNPKRILETARAMLDKNNDWEIPFGDGRAAERILDICQRVFKIE
jgi:UDP-N-acetylglucosamine 2-epimerase (non-hydrolysing)